MWPTALAWTGQPAAGRLSAHLNNTVDARDTGPDDVTGATAALQGQSRDAARRVD